MTQEPAPYSAETWAQERQFIQEIDKVKHILRRTVLCDESRRENDAEHSWHISVMAMMLAKYSAAPVDANKVVRMTLIHDLVEIDAGDTFAYDTKAAKDKEARERQAAARIFGLLPPPEAEEFRQLWEEFEAMETPDALFAAAMDRLQPLILNDCSQGAAWREGGVARSQVLARMDVIRRIAPGLWPAVEEIVARNVALGNLREG